MEATKKYMRVVNVAMEIALNWVKWKKMIYVNLPQKIGIKVVLDVDFDFYVGSIYCEDDQFEEAVHWIILYGL